MENLEGLVRTIVASVTSSSRESQEPDNCRQDRQARRPGPSTSVEDEISCRFGIPRRGGGAGSSSGTSTETSINTNTRSQYRDLSQYFQPSENYGYRQARGSRQGRQRRRASPYQNPQRNPSQSKLDSTPVIKEIVLLPNPDIDKIPKFQNKVQLNEHGLIVDGYKIDRRWTEQQLKQNLASLFFNKVKDEQGVVRYSTHNSFCFQLVLYYLSYGIMCSIRRDIIYMSLNIISLINRLRE